MRTSSVRLLAITLAVLAFAASCSLRTSGPPTPAEVASQLDRLAVPFVANAGQSDPRVAYYASTFSGTVFVTRHGELVYALPAPGHRGADQQEPASGWTLTEGFVDGHPEPIGMHSAATHVSVFAGSDSARWQRDVASYADVDLGAVWPGISVALTAHGKQVEKVFTVEPGAAPDTIRVRVAGAESLAAAADGGLVLHTGVGDVRLTPPVAYQESAGTRRMLPAHYAISGDEYGVRVSGYDPTLPVVIDPLLQATPLGGSGDDQAFTLAIGPAGDVYVAGVTASFNFPGTGPGAQPRFGGSTDAFIARLTDDLTGLEEATFLGGSGDDQALALAIAPTTGDVYVAGLTSSANFPGTSGGAQSALGDVNLADPLDGFVARLSASLTSLEQATYLGGSGNRDAAVALAIAPATGAVYVAGSTNSVDFPGIPGGAQTVPGGGQNDTFIARLNAGLTTLGQATFFGGTGEDRPLDMTIAPTTGDVYVTGRTDSIDLPGTNGGAESELAGVQDAFVARLNASLTALRQATYLGGAGGEEGDALAIAPTTGEVYIAGSTASDDFPGTAGGAQSVIGGGTTDAFVARLSADLTSLDQATYLGGRCPAGVSLCRDIPVAMRLTTSDVYVAGTTDSTNFPGTVGGAQSAPGGSSDAFVARLSTDLTALHQATYLGGANTDGAGDLVIAPATGDVYVAGFTASTVFPGTAGGAQGAPGGGLDAFVARLSADLSSTPTTTTTSSSTTTTRPTTTTTSTTRPTTTTTSTTRPTTTSTSSTTSSSTSTSTSSSTTTTRAPTTTTTSSSTTTVPTSSTTSSTTTTRPTTTSSTTTSSTTTTSLVVTNTPPTVSIDDLPNNVTRKDLASGRLLTLDLTVSEPATITLDILNGRGTSVRQTTLTRTSAGSFEAQISLRRLRGKLTLRVTATDVDGASSVVEQEFKAQ